MVTITRFLTCCSLAAVVAFAPPALAEEGPYLGANFGAVFLDDSTVESDSSSFDIEYREGVSYGGAIGYDTGTYFSKSKDVTGRIDFEYTYRINDADEVEEGGAFRPVDGEVEVSSYMVNSWVDFRTESVFRPYIGVGAGAAQLTFDNGGFSDDSDLRFAYQAGGGIGVPIGGHLTFTIGYRYFASLDATLSAEVFDPVTNTTTEKEFDIEYDSHNIDVGLRLTF